MLGESLNLREKALRHRHMVHQEKWSEHTKPLTPLKVGDRVRIQNQTGPHPNKWDCTGIVIKVWQFHQYLVRVDGSGRQTLRNRKFLRKYIPVYQPVKRRPIIKDIAHLPPSSACKDTITSLKPPTTPPPTTPFPDDTITHHPSHPTIRLLYIPIHQRRTPHLPQLQPGLVWKSTPPHHQLYVIRLPDHDSPHTRDSQRPYPTSIHPKPRCH